MRSIQDGRSHEMTQRASASEVTPDTTLWKRCLITNSLILGFSPRGWPGPVLRIVVQVGFHLHVRLTLSGRPALPVASRVVELPLRRRDAEHGDVGGDVSLPALGRFER